MPCNMDIYQIIVKKLTGEITAAEEEYFIRWIKSHSDNRIFYEQLKRYWEFKDIGIEEKKKKVWSRLRQQIDASKEKAEIRKQARVIPFRKVYWMAASVFFLLCVALLYIRFEPDQPVTHGTELAEKSTTSGQNLTLRLPDGTQVKLNAESRIKYPKAFSDSGKSSSPGR